MDADPHAPRPMSESSLAARDHHGPGHGVNRDRENLLRAIKTHAPDVSPEDRSRITEALLVDGWTGPAGASTGPRPGQVAPDVTAVASEALEEEPPVGSVVLDREGYPHHREERGWMSTAPAGPAHVPWSTVRDVCGPLTLLVPAAAPDAVPEGRWTYNPESHVVLSREVVVILKQCVSPAAEQFSSEIREAVDSVNEALSAWNMHRVAQMQAPSPTPARVPLPSEAVEAARTWIANCVDPVVVGPVAKQAMLDYLDGRRDRPTDEDFQSLRALPAADQGARDEATVRDALVIRVGRLAGSQNAARELTAEVTKGRPVVLDFRDNRSAAPSFVGALLFYATFPPDNTNPVEVVNASPEVVEAAEAWIAQSGRVSAGTITFR